MNQWKTKQCIVCGKEFTEDRPGWPTARGTIHADCGFFSGTKKTREARVRVEAAKTGDGNNG